MIPHHTRGLSLAAMFAMAVVVACARDAKQDELATDSALQRDLARAGADSAVQPQLQDVPAKDSAPTPAVLPSPAPAPTTTPRPRPKPATPKPQPAPPKPAPAPEPTTTPNGNGVEKGTGAAERATGVIAAGTTMKLDAASSVCTNTSKVGDRFTATVADAVTGTNGVTIPSGADVTLELTELKRSENTNDQITMGFRVISVSFGGKTFPLDADVQTATIDRVRASSKGNDAKKVAGGAAVGAIIGQVLGKNKKGTIIGAATGAAAGAAAAAATANYEGCVNTGADIVVKLNASLTIAAMQ